jgi:hypothetical protein
VIRHCAEIGGRDLKWKTPGFGDFFEDMESIVVLHFRLCRAVRKYSKINEKFK